MKYFIRSVKYFLYITVIFAFVIWFLASLANKRLVYKPDDILATLIHGINSIWLILGVFAIFAAIYPMLGYMKRQLAIGGSVDELKGGIDEFMESRGYYFEKKTEDSLCYRNSSPSSRFTRVYEDRITIMQTAGGLVMEGLRKDVARLAMGLETRFGSFEQQD